MRLTRRELMAACACASALPAPAAGGENGRGSLGFVVHSFPVRTASDRGFAAPARFLEYCRSLGARTVQVGLGKLDDPAADALRDRAGAASITLEGSVSPPR